jgi:glycosyltransferase involved in cell wall biosynthesis
MSVSIIIPAWNAADTLRETIDSALSQRMASEVIVIDDGSTDETLAIARAFGNHVVCLTGLNNGVAIARNRGFIESRGSWIQFLDSDDLLTTDTIAARLDALQSQSAEVAVTSWTEFHSAAHDDATHLLTRVANWDRLRNEGVAIACATSFWAPPAAVLYHRNVVARVGGFLPSVSPIEDARFLFDAANLGARFCSVDQVGALYRVLPNSFSRRDPARFALAVYKNGQDIEEKWRNAGGPTKPEVAALIELYDGAACALFRAQRDEFRLALNKVLAFGGRPSRYLRYAKIASRLVGIRAARAAFGALGR